jgi:hypothetical protein
VHLQFLGYPIANDPVYCSSAWGDGGGKGGIAVSEQRTVVDAVTNQAFAKDVEPKEQPEQVSISMNESDKQELVKRDCQECQLDRMDPMPQQLEIWLHSYQYQNGDEWMYETELPEWAHESFDGDKVLVDRFWKYGGLWDGKAPGELNLE